MHRWALVATLVTGCGGSSPPPQYAGADVGRQPDGVEIRLEPQVAGQQWYRARSTCAQGPFELDVPVTGVKWGEDVELRLHTPRKVALHAVILVDGKETEVADAVFDGGGTAAGKPDNARCIADARERLVLGRTGTGTPGTPGTTGTPGTLVVPPPDRATQTPQLDLDTSLVTASVTVIGFRLRDRAPGTPIPQVRIRFWSIDPNDLDGVLFGVAHIEWRPNVTEEQYDAHLRWLEERARIDAELRARPPVRATAVVTVETAAETEARRKRYEADRKRRLDDERKLEERRRQQEIAAALEVERRLRRRQFCASHPKDRDCWGAGGFAIHLEFERHRQERAEYCAQHQEEARCWSDDESARRHGVWRERMTVALAPPKQPDGPPPVALAEEVPPRLSVHADWRPGYWQWTAGTWVWLAGMWRVPEEDIASEQTTTAPAAPPPEKPEVAPVAPVATAVWLPGFWQWNSTSWVWIAGSWQLRPEPRVTWRAAQWQPRGTLHVLIPGGWVRIGGGR